MKESLRSAARQALHERGYTVELSPGKGLAPGARLRIARGDEAPMLVAVRTSASRQIGLLRNTSGRWRTIHEVQLVLASVPLGVGIADVEVLAFDPQFLVDVFDEVANGQKGPPATALKAPVFVDLDRPLVTAESTQKNLAAYALWRRVITPSQSVHSYSELIDLLKKEVSRATGLDVTKIEIEIKITL